MQIGGNNNISIDTSISLLNLIFIVRGEAGTHLMVSDTDNIFILYKPSAIQILWPD